MALKILLADDSMTAQNMGKKILADAGYEVITVSNGAAAIKRISSDRPDVVIVDVYMPGYTGLEVCERVKNAAETARLPVLLTVGKMEPFKPEDANRVHADGVLIKPFEASELAAAVQAIVKRLVGPVAMAAKAEAEKAIRLTPASPEETVRLTAEEVAELDIRGEWKTSEVAADKLELSPEMAATPALADLLDIEHASSAAIPSAAQSVAPRATAQADPTPVFELSDADLAPAGERQSASSGAQPAFNLKLGDQPRVYKAPDQPPSATAAPAYRWGAHTPEMGARAVAGTPMRQPPVSSVSAAHQQHYSPAPDGAGQSQLRPATGSQASAASAEASIETEAGLEVNQPVSSPPPIIPAEFEFNAGPQAGFIAVERAPELVVEEVTPVEVVSTTDPALVTDPDEMAAFSVHVGSDSESDEPVIAPLDHAKPAVNPPDLPGAMAGSDAAWLAPDAALNSAPPVGAQAGTVTEIEIPRGLDDTQPIPRFQVSPQAAGSVAELAAQAVAAIDPSIAAELEDVTIEEVESVVEGAPPLAVEVERSVFPNKIAGAIPSADSVRHFPKPSEPALPLRPAGGAKPAVAGTAAVAGSDRAPAAVSEEAIARAVMRAVERLRPDLVAEIAKELDKSKT